MAGVADFGEPSHSGTQDGARALEVKAPEAVLSLAGQATDSSTRLDYYLRRATRYWRCLTCDGNPIKERTHFSSRQKLQHLGKKLDEAEQAAWAREQYNKEAFGNSDMLDKRRRADSGVSGEPQATGSSGVEGLRAPPVAGARKVFKLRKEYVFSFGKHAGETMRQVLQTHRSYVANWLVRQTELLQQARHHDLRTALIGLGFLLENLELGPRSFGKRKNWRRTKFGDPRFPHFCHICGVEGHHRDQCELGSRR